MYSSMQTHIRNVCLKISPKPDRSNKRLEIFLYDNDLEELNHELCYMKLTVRLCLLLNSKGEQQKNGVIYIRKQMLVY